MDTSMFDPMDDEEVDPISGIRMAPKVPRIAAPMSEKPPINLPGIGAPIPSVTPSQPRVNPQMAADKSELQRLESTGSGVSQLQKRRPGLGTLARIADVVGSIAAPGAAAMIPGTSLHHDMLVNRQRGEVANDAAVQEKEAQGNEENARASAYANPPAKEKPIGSTVETGDGVFQWNPETNRYDTKVGPPKTTQSQLTDPKAGYAQAIADAIKNGRDPNTDPHVAAWKNAVDQVHPEKPEAPHTVVTAEGVMQYNPETGRYDKRIGSAPQMVIADTNRTTKQDLARNKEEGSLQSFDADMDRLATAANELKNHPGLSGITGMMGTIPNLPGGQAANAQAKFDTLKSQVAFNVLQNLRNQSKTGGALGQISDKEEQMLASNIASLERAQSMPELQKSLQTIIDFTAGSKIRAHDAFNRTYGGGNPQAQQPHAQSDQVIEYERGADGKLHPKMQVH